MFYRCMSCNLFVAIQKAELIYIKIIHCNSFCIYALIKMSDISYTRRNLNIYAFYIVIFVLSTMTLVILFVNEGPPWSSCLRHLSSSHDYLPLTAKVIGSSPARFNHFIWPGFELLAEGRWFYSVWIMLRSSSTNTSG